MTYVEFAEKFNLLQGDGLVSTSIIINDFYLSEHELKIGKGQESNQKM
jgi:hypothetical protein